MTFEAWWNLFLESAGSEFKDENLTTEPYSEAGFKELAGKVWYAGRASLADERYGARFDLDDECGPECWAMPDCAVCGLRKHPVGRDPGIAAANGYCGHDCEGYKQDPQPGHYWPGEEPNPT